MTKKDIFEFIERMADFGDEWEFADVKRVYGKMSLQEALDDRMGALNTFANIISTVLNRK